MHKTSALLKGEARFSILGHLPTCVGTGAFFLLTSFLLSQLAADAIPGIGPVSLLLSQLVIWLVAVFCGILEYGLSGIYMNLQYQQPTSFQDLFAGFTTSPDTIIQIEAVRSGIATLCSAPATICLYLLLQKGVRSLSWKELCLFPLLLIGGEIISLYFDAMFSMSYYLLLDYPHLTGIRALAMSRRLMKGRKLLYVYVSLSFLPLFLLGLVTFGIGLLWIFPYRQATNSAFYKNVIVGSKGKTA